MTAAAATAGTEARNTSAPSVDDGVTDFTFRFLGYRFRAWSPAGTEKPKLLVACDLGDLPYSAESRHSRRHALMALSRASRFDGTTLYMTDFRRVSLIAEVPVADPGDATGLIAGAALAVCRNIVLIGLFGELLGPPSAATNG